MFCISAFIILAILGIFSATHRKLAKEAFECVFRRVTLRPCNTGFDTKMKAKILGKLISKSPKTASFISKRFELVSWLFMLTTLVSIIYTARGLVNYWAWGSCNGLNQSGFCVFDPVGKNNKVSAFTNECSVDPNRAEKLSLESLTLDSFPKKGFDWDKQVVFIGCYNCEYTRKAYPLIKKLLTEVTADFIFVHFPTREETGYLSAYDRCVYQQDKIAFWEYVDKLFAAEKGRVADPTFVDNVLTDLKLDIDEIRQCVESDETKNMVKHQIEEIKKTGVYGTPTIFLNGKAIVGPKPYRVYKRLLKK